MMARKLLLTLLCLLAMALHAGTNLIPDGDFENGLGAWGDYEFGETQRGYGFNGNCGLKISRKAGDAYGCNRYAVQLEPNVVYIMSTMIRTENLENGTACLAIEFYDEKGNWLPQSIYRPGPQGTQDWSRLEQKFVAPDLPNAKAFALVYLSKGATGTAYFDDVSLMPLDIPPEIQLVYPTQGRLNASGSLVRFAIAKQGNTIGDKAFEAMTAKVTFSQGGTPFAEISAPLVGHLTEVQLSHAPIGEIALHAELYDAGGSLLSQSDATLNALENISDDSPRGACFIDEYGRAIVDGKPYLPIGLFLENTKHDDDLELIYDSDFNCIMAYGSPRMQLPKSGTTGIPGILETLDALDAHGMKTIFCLKDLFDLPRYKGMMDWIAKNIGTSTGDQQVMKLVNSLRKHPAILAWYDSDEVPLTERPIVAARRQLINRLDPFHPTWGVMDNALEASFYGSTCDVMGIDPYPIRTKEISDQQRTIDLVEAAKASGQSCWAVPQIFNWGVYPYKGRIPAEFTGWKQPTLEQMRGIILMEALYGSRGFVCYSFFDLKIYSLKREDFNGADYATREDFLKHWEDAKTLATMLKELEPWILSKNGPKPANLQIKTGNAHAALFQTDENNTPCAIIANVGPDNLEATLFLPPELPPMKALYGHATETAPGIWKLHGHDVWGEVLIPQ